MADGFDVAGFDGPGMIAVARNALRRSRAISADAALLRAQSRVVRARVKSDRVKRDVPTRRTTRAIHPG